MEICLFYDMTLLIPLPSLEVYGIRTLLCIGRWLLDIFNVVVFLGTRVDILVPTKALNVIGNVDLLMKFSDVPPIAVWSWPETLQFCQHHSDGSFRSRFGNGIPTGPIRVSFKPGPVA